MKIVLTVGQIHDLARADALLPGMQAKALLADKAYDADKRVFGFRMLAVKNSRKRLAA